MRDRDRPLLDGPMPEGDNALRPGEVLVWLVDAAAHNEPIAAIMGALTDAEQAELRRLAIAHRQRFAVGRLSLRRLIGRQLGIAPPRVGIIREPGGRPRIDPALKSSLSFNISYAGDKVLIALADSANVGVDIEQVRAIAEEDLIVRSRFSPQELKAWSRLAAEARCAAFYEAWTRKEAVLKAVGLGLVFPLDRLTVTFGAGQEARVVELDGHDGNDVRLLDISDIPEHKAALAVLPGGCTRSTVSGDVVMRRLPDWSPAGPRVRPRDNDAVG